MCWFANNCPDIKPLLQSLLEKHMESYEADRWMFEPDESKKNA